MTNRRSLGMLCAVVLLSGCIAPRSELPRGPEQPIEQAPNAVALVARHAKRFRIAPKGLAQRGPLAHPVGPVPAIDPSSVARFLPKGELIRAELPSRSVRAARPATTLFPARADGHFHVTDDKSGASLAVRLVGARPVPAQAAGGYLVYPGAHADGADVLHHAVPSGTEDLFVFETAPAEETVRYEITLGERIAGLRLIDSTLELLDADGAPELRVPRPYLIEEGGRRADATLAVEGCATDTNPAGPWGRAVVAPGARACTVRIGWADQKVVYPALLDPNWTNAGDMTTPRWKPQAVVLNTGKVIVVGDSSTGGTELYDPISGLFAATGSLQQVRSSGHVMTKLQSGLVLVCGGQNFVGHDQETCEKYDPVAGTWSLTASMTAKRTNSTMTLLSSGKVLVTGGLGQTLPVPSVQQVMKTAEVYSPAGGGSWTPTVNKMSVTRWEHTAALLPSGKVLVSGGLDAVQPTGVQQASVDLYDPSTNSFTPAPSLSPGRLGHTCTVLPNGKVLVAGGVAQGGLILNEVWFYDPAGGPAGSWSAGPAMPLKRSGAADAILNDGNVLIFGGVESGYANPTTMLYYPSLNYWSTGASLNNGREYHAGVKLNDGRALVAGGWLGDFVTITDTAEVYDFKSDGAACGSASECTTGSCVAGICCDIPCTVPNATSACTTGQCRITSCVAPFANCDATASNGCETDLSTTATSCGGCNAACSTSNVNPACAGASCQAGVCTAGWGDCNNNKRTDGCEKNVASGDPLSCGACGQACNTTTGTPTCSGSTCSYVCNAGRKDCTNAAPNLNGCETNSTVNGNCGGCGITCPNATCTTGACKVVAGEGTCTSINTSACANPFCKLSTTGCTTTWKDTDGDGLSDAWETPVTGENNGDPFVDLNCNGRWDGATVDISLKGATTGTKDIFVYYNYMNTHNHQPPQAAIDAVVAAFARHQINVHFADGGPITETVVTTLDSSVNPSCTGGSASTMKDLRVAYFGNRQPAFHYMVFGHRAITPDASHAGSCPTDSQCSVLPDPDATGVADLPGDDIIISFGALMEANSEIPPEPFLYATTIMHELGHNLGLKHGGADACTLNKPNYISVMNPKTYQLNGIPVADNFGSNGFRVCTSDANCGPPTMTPPHPCATANACYCTTGQEAVYGFNYCYRVDYSGNSLIALNETGTGCTAGKSCTGGGMDESVGVGGPSTSEDVVFFYVPGPSQQQGSSTGAIDWDNDTFTTNAHVNADVNNDNGNTNLTTQLDWSLLNFQFQCSGGYGAGAAINQASRELSPTAAAKENARYLPRKAKIDVRPACPTNWLVVGSPLKVPVALYGEATFDVSTIDLNSLRFAGAPPVHVAMSDLDGDGKKDLLLDFTMSSLAIRSSQTKVNLTGARTIGQSFHSSDAVTIIPNAGPVVTLHDDGLGYSRSLEGPPNHELVTYSLADCVDSAVDRCGRSLHANTAGKILRITCDEANGGGGPHGASDMAINSSSSFSVRKERSGNGDGRVYTVIFTETDTDGGSTQAQCKIQVPHHAGSRAATDSGVASCVGSGCSADLPALKRH